MRGNATSTFSLSFWVSIFNPYLQLLPVVFVTSPNLFSQVCTLWVFCTEADSEELQSSHRNQHTNAHKYFTWRSRPRKGREVSEQPVHSTVKWSVSTAMHTYKVPPGLLWRWQRCMPSWKYKSSAKSKSIYKKSVNILEWWWLTHSHNVAASLVLLSVLIHAPATQPTSPQM